MLGFAAAAESLRSRLRWQRSRGCCAGLQKPVRLPAYGRPVSTNAFPNADVCELGYPVKCDEKRSNGAPDCPSARELVLWGRRTGGAATHVGAGGSIVSSVPKAPVAAVVARGFRRLSLRRIGLASHGAYKSRVPGFIRNTKRAQLCGDRDLYGAVVLVARDISKRCVSLRIGIGALLDASRRSYSLSRFSDSSVTRRSHLCKGTNHRSAGGTADQAGISALVGWHCRTYDPPE